MRDKAERHQHHHPHHEWLHEPNRFRNSSTAQKGGAVGTIEPKTVKFPSQDISPLTVVDHSRFRRASLAPNGGIERKEVPSKDANRRESEPDRLGMASASRFRTRSRSRSPGPSVNHSYREQSPDGRSFGLSTAPSDDESDGDEDEQDIEELWFSGGHGDIGGGWYFPSLLYCVTLANRIGGSRMEKFPLLICRLHGSCARQESRGFSLTKRR